MAGSGEAAAHEGGARIGAVRNGYNPAAARDPGSMGRDGRAEVTRRLLTAAAVSGARLVAVAAREVAGWAAVVDPVAGPVYWSPGAHAAAAAAAAGRPVPEVEGAGPVTVVVSPTSAGATFLLGVGPDTCPVVRDTVVTVTTAAVEIRARRADEIRASEAAVHTAVVRLLLGAETELAQEVAAGAGACLGQRMTLYRLTGGPDPAATHDGLWRAIVPAAARHYRHALVARLDHEIALLLADTSPDCETGPDGEEELQALIARAADHWDLLGGIAEPVPVNHLAAAWADAGHAQRAATTGRRLVPAAGLGDRALLRLIPADRVAAWTSALLAPLDAVLRETLDAWLHTGSDVTATARYMGLSRTTIQTRLHRAQQLLHADLGQACVRVRILLALRASVAGDTPAKPPEPVEPVDPATDCLVALMDAPVAQRWATGLVAHLGPDLRETLLTWMDHHGRASPAAADLGVHRNTVSARIRRAQQLLPDLDMGDAWSRAQLYLALLTTQVIEQETRPLPQEAPSSQGGRG